jgi:hypothetical protein
MRLANSAPWTGKSAAGSGMEKTGAKRDAPSRKKFFGSFFQKRTIKTKTSF